MDTSTTLTITQMILQWVLFGFLLAWLVIFAVLALHMNPTGESKSEELVTPARSFPAAPASMSLHMIATQPVPVAIGNVAHTASEEIGTVPIA